MSGLDKISQVACIGLPHPRTWLDYREGCLATFGGGHTGEKLEAFRHGMETVFNLLEAEFPSAEQCKAAPRLLKATSIMREVLSYVLQKAPGYNWNADELGLTRLTGKAFAKADETISEATRESP